MRRGGRGWSRGGALLLGALSLACAAAPVPHGIPPGPRPAPAPSDSLDGIVRVTGTDAEHIVLLLPAAGAAVRLQGADAALLRAVDGLALRVHGRWAPPALAAPPGAAAQLMVTRLQVIAVDGMPALDGTLWRAGGRWLLRSQAGVDYRLPEPLPAPLLGLEGARIFWAGGVDAPPRAYGILSLPPAQRRR